MRTDHYIYAHVAPGLQLNHLWRRMKQIELMSEFHDRVTHVPRVHGEQFTNDLWSLHRRVRQRLVPSVWCHPSIIQVVLSVHLVHMRV
jgi:hypothetical protein